MKIIRELIAALVACVISLGYALPAVAVALEVKTSGGQGTVQVGTGGAVHTGVGAQLGGSAGSGSGSVSGSGDVSVQGGDSASGSASPAGGASGNATVDVSPLLMTRIDVDSGAVKATVSAPSRVVTHADLSGFVAAQMKGDANVSAVESASDSVAVTYKQIVKLFGFIPVSADATATVDAGGNVSVSFPWWTIFAATHRDELQAKLQDRVNAAIGANANANANAHATVGKNGVVSGNASATGTMEANANANANAAAQLSAQTQAKLVAAIRAAMQEELNVSGNTSGSANVQ